MPKLHLSRWLMIGIWPLALGFFLWPMISVSAQIPVENSPTLFSRLFNISGWTERLRYQVEYINWRNEAQELHRDLLSQAYLVAEISDDGELTPVLSRLENQPRPIASITKLMSATVALDRIEDLGQPTTLSYLLRASQDPNDSPTQFFYSSAAASDLLRASLIQSTNEAAEKLTHFLPPGQFVEAMNEKVQDLGLNKTIFYDAHGLSPQNQSTPLNIASLATHIHRYYPKIWTITREKDFQLPGGPNGQWLTFRNLNNFHGIDKEFIGGKTGYLPESGQTYVALFDINGQQSVIVLLDSKNRVADTLTLFNYLSQRPTRFGAK